MKKMILIAALMLMAGLAFGQVFEPPTAVPIDGTYKFTGDAIVNGSYIQLGMIMTIIKKGNVMNYFGDLNSNGKQEADEVEIIYGFPNSANGITSLGGMAPSGPTVLFFKDSRGDYFCYLVDMYNGIDMLMAMEKVK